MDFSISEEQKVLLNSIAGRSKEFSKSYWDEKYEKREFPFEYWNAFAKVGFFGFLVPKKLGGTERSFLDFVSLIATAAQENAGAMAYLLLSGALVAEMFASAPDELKEEILPRVASGSLKISIALTEEQSGQEARAIVSRVTKETTEGYLLSGKKVFVNNAEISDFILLFANTSGSDSQIVPFLVESANPVLVRVEQEKLGYDPLRIHSLSFENLIVGKSRRLLGDNNDKKTNPWRNSLRVFSMDRIATAALLCGTAKLAIREAAEYSNERKVFGRSIGANQGLQFPLAEAYMNLEASENLAYKAAWLYDNGKPEFSVLGAMALSKAVRSSFVATDAALQCFGGHGYLKSYPVQRYWKDVRAYGVHPVSKELLAAMIAEKALGLPRSY